MNYYNEISQGYEELYKEEQIKKLNFIKEFLEKLNIKIKETDKVLDVGCGTGLTTRAWPSKNRIGIDPAEKLIEKAKQKDKNSNYVIAPAENIPFKANTFDVVVSITAIQNFQDIKKGLIEIKRVSKNLIILSFLKKSEKKEFILNLIKSLFKIKDIIEEDNDIIVICYK
jgi:ubiquinone/menaquinone biosynthesis C-methylase UbiE